MTADKALYRFFSGFGVPAYPDTAVPDDTVMPYLTYSVALSGWEDSPAPLTVKLWYHTESEAAPTEKAGEIIRAIGLGGVQLPCQGGSVWLTMGQPQCVSFAHESDHFIKGRQLNVSAVYNCISPA